MNIIYKENNPSVTAKEVFQQEGRKNFSFPPHRMTVLYVKLVVLGVKETTTGSTMLIGAKLVPDVRIGLDSSLPS